MVFFRLGKIARGDKEDKQPVPDDHPDAAPVRSRTESPGASVRGEAALTAGCGPVRVDALTAPTASKKKKEGDGPAPGGGAAASSLGAGAVPGDRRAGAGPTRAQAGLSVNDFISKTKNQQKQGVKPSGPELIAYARYLGIDPVADHDLLWIAVEALEAPLPSDWTEHFDSVDRVFYYNAATRVSSWTHPMEKIYRDTYTTIVQFRNASMAPAERSEKLALLHQEIKQMEHDVHKEIAQWTEHTDEQGNRFYFNREERQSTWTDPRPAKCQVLYLRMKMLRLLQSGTAATPGFAQPLGGCDAKSSTASRFEPLSTDFDEPGKIGGARKQSGEVPSGDRLADRHGDRHGHGSVGGGSGSTAPEFPRGNSPGSSPRGSDSESDDDRKRRKKKKKKKKRREERDNQVAMPPVHAGVSQNLGISQSEPSIGKLPLGSFDQPDVLSQVGRERVKAGIRLEPIGVGGPGDGPGVPASAGPASAASSAVGSGVGAPSSASSNAIDLS